MWPSRWNIPGWKSRGSSEEIPAIWWWVWYSDIPALRPGEIYSIYIYISPLRIQNWDTYDLNGMKYVQEWGSRVSSWDSTDSSNEDCWCCSLVALIRSVFRPLRPFVLSMAVFARTTTFEMRKADPRVCLKKGPTWGPCERIVSEDLSGKQARVSFILVIGLWHTFYRQEF